ncbi:MAG: ABC transporter permease [Actinomycetota bacterium]|nr:ABC transporter permease [Actinomycetota bacterium]
MAPEAARAFTPERVAAQPHRRRLVTLRSFLRDRTAFLGLTIVAFYFAAAISAPWLAPGDPNAVDFGARFETPSLEHPFGTDNLGRDVADRILRGAPISMGLAVAATFGIGALGLGLGLLAAMRGRAIDAVIMRVVDALQALPGLLLALALIGVLGPSLRNLVVAIVAVWWGDYARVVRSMTLSIRERPFVEAARALGASEVRIMLRHVLPNLIGPIVVLSTLDMGRTLLAVSGLSFLGLGARPPTPEWGAMLAEAKDHLSMTPMLLVYPGMAITLFVLAFNLLGDGLRDALDPRMRRAGARVPPAN